MPRRFSVLVVTVAALMSAAVFASWASAAIPAWTTYRHDAARSGIDPDSTNRVTPTQAWQTGQGSLDGEVYAQPLVYGSYVYVATENDTIYELDAATGDVLWTSHLATPEPASAEPCPAGDIDPTIGITSTPVIDPTTGRIYAVGAVSTPGGAIEHELFALDLMTGRLVAGFPINVDPPFPSGGTPANQLQRAGLALDAGRILIGYGGNDGDCNTYWGWLVSAPTDGTGELDTFQVDPGYDQGAIWGAGNAPAIDGAGDVFVATGNGTSTSASNPDFGDSVVKLNASATWMDWWAPPNWQSLDNNDLDLGSSMPTLLPGGYLFESGKDGNGYLLDGAHLGNVSNPGSEIDGFCPGGSFGGSVYEPSTATIYVACGGGLQAVSLGPGTPPSLKLDSAFSAPSNASGPPMIAGGLVWAIDYSSGTLYGLDPGSGGPRSQFAIPENVESGGSDVNHFASPSAGGGRLFVASGNQVTAFTIARPPAPTATSTTLVASADAVSAGAALTLTAQVSPAPDAGTVTFTDGGAPISGCSGVPVSIATAGHAVCTTSFAQAGTHNLTASYSGDPYYDASASAILAESVTSSAATAGGGSTSAPGPRLSHASIAPRRFKAGHRATLRVNLSTAATLTVMVTRLRGGRRVGHRCSLHARTGKPCLVRVTPLRLHFKGRAGRNAFRLPLRHLAPGRYTAVIYATDPAGRRSRTIRIAFTIIPVRP